MLNVSTAQLLDVWMTLEDALRGKHDYDGHTAEIYLYRVQTNTLRPTPEFQDAEASLIEILELFAKLRNAKVKMVDHQGHRVHVRIKPAKKEGGGKAIIPIEYR